MGTRRIRIRGSALLLAFALGRLLGVDRQKDAMKRHGMRALASVSVVAVLAFASGWPDQVPMAGVAQAAHQKHVHEAQEQAGNVLFVRPARWERRNNPDGTVTLIPPDLPRGRQVGVLIMQGGDVPGANLRVWFDSAWQVLLEANQARVLSGGEVQARRVDDFDVVSTTAILESAAGERTYVTLFVASPGTRTEAVLFAADGEDLYRKHIASVSRLLETVRFVNLQPGGPAVAEAGRPTAPSVPGPGELQIGSMYVSFAAQEAYRLAIGNYRFDFLVLYTNGLVYRGGGAPLVQGPPAIDLASPLMQYNLGSYKVVGNEVHITMPSGQTDVYEREGDRLGAWRRLAEVDGLRLQGTYFDTPYPPTAAWITFAPDGTFRDQGVVNLVSLHYLEKGLTPPSGGAGTYTIRDYTLTLRYTNGLTERMMFFVLPGQNLSRPSAFVLNVDIFELQQ